jgi:hypothetical protein
MRQQCTLETEEHKITIVVDSRRKPRLQKKAAHCRDADELVAHLDSWLIQRRLRNMITGRPAQTARQTAEGYFK